jgi:periplasmic copper chaperone A
MNHMTLHRRGVLRACMALGASLLAPAARAHEFFSSSLTVIHPWTRASAEGATTAIVSMIFQDVIQTDRLIGAQTPVAEAAELGGSAAGPALDFLIREGQTTELSETGVHLRLLRLKFPLLQGREYPMTLVFEKGGAIRAALLVDYPPPV